MRFRFNPWAVRASRERAGLSTRAVADLLQVSRTTVIGTERPGANPTAATIGDLAGLYGVDVGPWFTPDVDVESNPGSRSLDGQATGAPTGG